MKKILLVYPQSPATFWSFRYALKFIAKKSSEPPLGLLTVAAMLPSSWELRLVDLNISTLNDADLYWADYVFLTGMNVHLTSMKEVIARSREIGVKVVAGGPFATSDPQVFEGVDHFILNEAEITLPRFLEDLEKGTPRKFYRSAEYPDLRLSPNPRWDLLNIKHYANMSVQYSRGCPYNCEFCSITLLNGNKPRTKDTEQFLRELDSLYQLGWRGTVFIVDDNFIGNRRKLKHELLPALIQWSKKNHYPFSFMTETSINLADDDQLVDLMVRAGFNSAFIGIETIHEESLNECGKTHNQQRDLLTSVKKLQQKGIMVSGGFIVGFDNDPPNIFQKQIEFIQKSGIVTAMIGLLNAPSGTRLFHRLKSENRLLNIMSGDNMDGSTNFIPKMGYETLRKGYEEILRKIYAPGDFYQRVKVFLKNYHLPLKTPIRVSWSEIGALFKSFWILGIMGKEKRYYWKLLLYSLIRYPTKFPLAVRMAIYGFHFQRVTQSIPQG
ncbi:MAG: B12-binding domain-containing radical SAM protein [Calditrichia bacterium]